MYLICFQFKREASEAETLKNEADDSLINAIMLNSANRQSQFDNMVKNLEAKYCKNKSTSRKKK